VFLINQQSADAQYKIEVKGYYKDIPTWLRTALQAIVELPKNEARANQDDVSAKAQLHCDSGIHIHCYDDKRS